MKYKMIITDSIGIQKNTETIQLRNWDILGFKW